MNKSEKLALMYDYAKDIKSFIGSISPNKRTPKKDKDMLIARIEYLLKLTKK